MKRSGNLRVILEGFEADSHGLADLELKFQQRQVFYVLQNRGYRLWKPPSLSAFLIDGKTAGM